MAQRKKIQECKKCGETTAHYDEGNAGWVCQLCQHSTPIKRRKSKTSKAIDAWMESGSIDSYLEYMAN